MVKLTNWMVRGLVSAAVLASVAAFAPAVQAEDAVAAPVAKCACQPCITYKHHILGCRKFRCCDMDKVVLQVTDPCCCCYFDVPVCVPCCCAKEAPSVCCRKGILGRTVVEYSWCCGYHVKVVIDRCGDVVVHYNGGV